MTPELREYEKQQKAALREVDARLRREEFGPAVVIVPWVGGVTAILTASGILYVADWEWVLHHWSNMAALIGGTAMWTGAAYHLGREATEAVLKRLRRH